MSINVKQRGRPRKPTASGGSLFREFYLVHRFLQARLKGQKYDSALEEARNAIAAEFPGEEMTRTDAKRVLARFMPRESDLYLGMTPQRASPSGARKIFDLAVLPKPEVRVNRAETE